jgi:Protein of unknown function (DUF3995)
MSRIGRITALRAVAVAGLGGVAVLHAAWARGSSFPARDRSSLADRVAGRETMPGALPCLAVAGALTAAAAVVGGAPVRRRRAAVAATSAALLARGAVGLAAGMPTPSESPRFRRLDRALYSPACLVLGAAALTGLRKRW